MNAQNPRTVVLGILLFVVTSSWSQPVPTTAFVSDTSFGGIFKFDEAGQRTIFASNVNNPQGVAFDIHGNLYVSISAGNQTIEKYNPSGGRSVFSSGGLLYQPRGFAFDSNGVLFVANAGTNTIIKLDSTGQQTLFVGTGGSPLIFHSASRLIETAFSVCDACS